MRIKYENEILKPPEIVFPWIADPEKAMQWQKNVKGGMIILEKPGKIGTTFEEVVEENGNSLKMKGIISEYIENEIIGFHLESKIHEFDVRYSVEDVNRNTKFSVEAIIHWKFPMSIISLFMKQKMETGLLEELESEFLDLKRICETGKK